MPKSSPNRSADNASTVHGLPAPLLSDGPSPSRSVASVGRKPASCKARTIAITAVGAYGLSFGCSVFTALLSVGQQDEKSSSIPWPVFAASAFLLVTETIKYWNGEWPMIRDNVDNTSSELEESSQASRPPTPGFGARTKGTKNCWTITKLLSSGFVFTLTDALDDAFVYVAFKTWIRNFRFPNDHSHYEQFDQPSDFAAFFIYFILSYGLKYYGEIAPSAYEFAGRPEPEKVLLEHPCFVPLQKPIYLANMHSHVLRELLPIFLLIPPEVAAMHYDKWYGMTAIAGLAVLFAIMYRVEYSATKHTEGRRFCERVNKNLISTHRTELERKLVNNAGWLICLMHFGDCTLPVRQAIETIFLPTQPYAALGIAVTLMLPVLSGIWYTEVVKARQEVERLAPVTANTRLKPGRGLSDRLPRPALGYGSVNDVADCRPEDDPEYGFAPGANGWDASGSEDDEMSDAAANGVIYSGARAPKSP